MSRVQTKDGELKMTVAEVELKRSQAFLRHKLLLHTASTISPLSIRAAVSSGLMKILG